MLKLNESKKERIKPEKTRDGSVGGKLLSQVQYTNNNNNTDIRRLCFMKNTCEIRLQCSINKRTLPKQNCYRIDSYFINTTTNISRLP